MIRASALASARASDPRASKVTSAPDVRSLIDQITQHLRLRLLGRHKTLNLDRLDSLSQELLGLRRQGVDMIRGEVPDDRALLKEADQDAPCDDQSDQPLSADPGMKPAAPLESSLMMRKTARP